MSGYRAAVETIAVTPRHDRAHLRVGGKDPVAMLQGILTNSVPAAPSATEPGAASGVAAYSAILTPKGRMVSDLRVVRGPREGDGLLLDVPTAARAALLAHFATYVPPRLARATDASGDLAALTVAGPDAPALLAREAFGLRVDAHDLEGLGEGAWRWSDTGGFGTLALGSADLAAPSWDLIGERGAIEALAARLREVGAVPLAAEDLAALRIEAGRPEWGADLDDATIPTEAGLDARAIDQAKGCYTGQEVIVRIRDRGHVNRHLRGLVLGGAPLPGRGAELWSPGKDQPVGSVTSAARSPRAGGGLALGWVRREVAVPGEMRVGGPDGALLEVRELGPDWWR